MTQQQHLSDTRTYSIRAVRDLHAEGRISLRPGANTHVESASDWYSSYGAHIHTEDAGDVEIQAVEYDWLDASSDAEVYDEHRDDLPEGLSREEAMDLIARAREVRESSEGIEAALDSVVEAYASGDTDAVIDALESASSIECEHGDDPATTDLMRRLLDVTPDED